MEFGILDDEYRKFGTPEEVLDKLDRNLKGFGEHNEVTSPYKVGGMMFKPEGGTRVVEQVFFMYLSTKTEAVKVEIVRQLIKYVEEKLKQKDYEECVFRNTTVYDLLIRVRYSEKRMVYVRIIADPSLLFAELITEQKGD